jgi:hypothetical protein
MRESTLNRPSFPEIVQQFFIEYLVVQRALSPQTVACYRDVRCTGNSGHCHLFFY